MKQGQAAGMPLRPHREVLQVFTRLNQTYETKLGKAILDGLLPIKKLQQLAKQVYLQEKWPSHIARVYLNLDERALEEREVVKYVLEIIRAENLGVGSHGASHINLIRRFAHFTGLSDNTLREARPSPQNQVLMDWCDMSALDRPWLEALAVHLACESQVTTMRRIARGLRANYGASAKNAEFWTVHGGPVERRHMHTGMSLVELHMRTDNYDAVHYSYTITLQLLRNFYDSILEV